MKNLLKAWPELVQADADFTRSHHLSDPPLGEWMSRQTFLYKELRKISPEAMPLMSIKEFKYFLEVIDRNTSSRWSNEMKRVIAKFEK